MWGGYVSAYGGEQVGVVGRPDGTRLTTVPVTPARIYNPALAGNPSRGSIRRTTSINVWIPVSSTRSECVYKTLHGAMAGIKALGWDRIPTGYYTPTAYKTWRNYIKTVPSGLLAG